MADCPDCAETLEPNATECAYCGCTLGAKPARDAEVYEEHPPEKGTSSVKIIVIVLAAVAFVGVAIIGILVAMLLPVMSKVKTKANQSNCKNNLRQLGLGLILYRDNQGNGDRFPDRDGGAFLVHLYTTGVTREPDLFVCPDTQQIADPSLFTEATASQATTYAGRRNADDASYPGIFSDTGASETAIACDDDLGNVPHEPEIIVLFLDGHVETIPRTDPRVSGGLGGGGLLDPLAD